jgi:hypothetical protein
MDSGKPKNSGKNLCQWHFVHHISYRLTWASEVILHKIFMKLQILGTDRKKKAN